MGKSMAVVMVLVWAQLHVAAETVDVEAPVVRLQLYKNGLAVVHQAFDIPGAGTYRLRDVPAARHGTFWVESDARIITRATTEEVEVPAEGAVTWSDYKGKIVDVSLRDGGSVRGRVESISTRSHEGGLVPESGVLVLSGAPADYVIAFQDVKMFRVDEEANGGKAATRTVSSNVLEFQAFDVPVGGGKIVFSYLTEGLSWMPSYRLERSDDDTLTITQAALVRNDWKDFDETVIEAISGFPNLEFANVLSPISSATTIANFLNQVNQRNQSEFLLNNGAVTQQAIFSNRIEPSFAAPAAPAETDTEAVDLYLQELGEFAMKKGDALSLDTLHGETTCASKVRWIIRAPGDGRNRANDVVPPSWRNRIGDPWDMLVFDNPFAQPLTTAPALVVAAGQLRGQSTLYWTNPKGQVEMPYTKALSIETRHEEYEDVNARTEVVVLKDSHTKMTFSGTIELTNHRAEAVEMEVVHYIEGTVLEGGTGEVRGLRQQATRLNPFNEVRWNITLESNKTETFTYRFSRVD